MASLSLSGKKILVIDDAEDARLLARKILEVDGATVTALESIEAGIEALKKLDEKPDTDIVLMDIMMPEMDGYDTMRAIRKIDRFKTLPIITLTAKAMKGDRDKCIAAGASDYITKPVDVAQLLSLMRVWLH